MPSGPAELGPVPVHQLEKLGHVGLCVLKHLVGAQHVSRLGLATGVADLCGPIADDQHELVSKLLELAELSQSDGVTEVDIGRARIEPHLEAQAFAGVQELDELGLYDGLRDTAPKQTVLLFLIQCS